MEAATSSQCSIHVDKCACSITLGFSGMHAITFKDILDDVTMYICCVDLYTNVPIYVYIYMHSYKVRSLLFLVHKVAM